MQQNLKRAYEYYIAHQEELAKQHRGKVLVIKGQKVIGVYESEIEAVKKTSLIHEMGTFLVQKAEPLGKSAPQSFHSRVAFK